MTELLRVADSDVIPTVIIQRVNHGKNGRMKGDKGGGAASGFPIAHPGELTKLNHKSP